MHGADVELRVTLRFDEAVGPDVPGEPLGWALVVETVTTRV
jgi:hypothetical protein